MRFMPIRKAEERVDCAAQRVRDPRQLLRLRVFPRRLPGQHGRAGDADLPPELGLSDALLQPDLLDRFRGFTSLDNFCCPCYFNFVKRFAGAPGKRLMCFYHNSDIAECQLLFPR